MKISASEKLILLMLCEIYEHHNIKGEFDHKFIESAIFNDNLWGFDWKYPSIFEEDSQKPKIVDEVVDILEMWDRIETSFDNLSSQEQQELAERTKLGASDFRFIGFDGNNEYQYISVVRFLVDDLERFKQFKGRADLNCHMPSIDLHNRLLNAYKPIQENLGNRDLSVEELASISQAFFYPKA